MLTAVENGGYQSALHWDPYTHPIEKKFLSMQHPTDVGGEWHDYGVEWDDSAYRFTFDGTVVWTETKCPGSKAPQFLLLTSESNIKGWSGERPERGCGLKDASKNIFEVDWVIC